jgi:hypothetical protein
VSSFTPGRSIVLKLLGCATGDIVMLFEETIPAGEKSTFHLHRDSDEVAYVLKDRRWGDGRRPWHLRLHAARRAAGLEQHRRGSRARPVFLYSDQGGGIDPRAAAAPVADLDR